MRLRLLAPNSRIELGPTKREAPICAGFGVNAVGPWLATQKVVGSSPIIRLENPLRRVYVARTETAESPMCPKTLAESCDRAAWSGGKE